MIRGFIDTFKDKYCCDYRRLCLTTKKVELNILTVTKIVEKDSVEMKEIKDVEGLECFTFKHKRYNFVEVGNFCQCSSASRRSGCQSHCKRVYQVSLFRM